MDRRNFFTAAAAMAPTSLTLAQPGDKKPSILELRYFRSRNTLDNQRGKLATFLGSALAPSLKRAGAATVGVFSASIAPDSPFYLMVAQYPSLGVFESAWDAVLMDEALAEPWGSLTSSTKLPFERMEVHLLRAFGKFPAIEVPPAPAQGAPGRIFEMRTYESNTPQSLMAKIGMFEGGEIDIFRKTGLNPVFFGAMIAGPKLPNLTYMLWHDSLAAREANWRAFVSHPEWKKLAATPGLSDGEVVSNISTALLSPIAGSMVK
jgi:hypothetical protein